MYQTDFNTSRRSFLKQSSATLGVSLAAPLILAQSAKGANGKLNLAWVGFGNQGWGDLGACSRDNNVVALCDCDPTIWERAKQRFPEAKFTPCGRRARCSSWR